MSKDSGMAKVFFEQEVNGETTFGNYTTTTAMLPFSVRVKPGIGKRYWTWPSVTNVPTVIGCDFTNAPIANSEPNVNLQAINAITATPEDVLIWS